MRRDSRLPALAGQQIVELKAQHLACSHLVKGCQDAIIRFRETTATEDQAQEANAAPRAIEILEEVLGSWCDTLSILHSALYRTSSANVPRDRRLEFIPGVLGNEPSRQGAAVDASGS